MFLQGSYLVAKLFADLLRAFSLFVLNKHCREIISYREKNTYEEWLFCSNDQNFPEQPRHR